MMTSVITTEPIKVFKKKRDLKELLTSLQVERFQEDNNNNAHGVLLISGKCWKELQNKS